MAMQLTPSVLWIIFPLALALAPEFRCINIIEQLTTGVINRKKKTKTPHRTHSGSVCSAHEKSSSVHSAAMKNHDQRSAPFSNPPFPSSSIPCLPGDGAEGPDDPRARVLLLDVPGVASCWQAGGADGQGTSPLRHTHPWRNAWRHPSGGASQSPGRPEEENGQTQGRHIALLLWIYV